MPLRSALSPHKPYQGFGQRKDWPSHLRGVFDGCCFMGADACHRPGMARLSCVITLWESPTQQLGDVTKSPIVSIPCRFFISSLDRCAPHHPPSCSPQPLEPHLLAEDLLGEQSTFVGMLRRGHHKKPALVVADENARTYLKPSRYHRRHHSQP